MIKGTLVRYIAQDMDSPWLCSPKIRTDKIGIVVDSKSESSWLSGHGPTIIESVYVQWEDGSIRWCSEDCLTTYGI